MSVVAMERLSNVFGANVVHDDLKAAATLTHAFGGENFLRGHFPGFPVVPGVILLDGMILAALHAFERLTGRSGSGVSGIAVDSVAFYRPVLPGLAADFNARAEQTEQTGRNFSARCSVMIDGVRHARASLIFRTQGDRASPAT